MRRLRPPAPRASVAAILESINSRASFECRLRADGGWKAGIDEIEDLERTGVTEFQDIAVAGCSGELGADDIHAQGNSGPG